ncbi:MAG: tyrosyl-tRNA synthetase [Candidatus Marinamargulisbacteria bacterium]|jgi:tyrosyl-tRNA synthetase
MKTLIDRFLNGVDEVIPEVEFQTLKPGLKIKFGADPSAPDLHLGHMVVLNKLRQLQEMGHRVQFVIGDFTAMIGDPTGRSETRKPLTKEDVAKNAETYQAQVFKILDKEKTEVFFNSHWLDKLTPSEIIGLTARHTVARMLERDDFKKRYKAEQPIGIHEFLYPLLQGYDSVFLESDIEIGGTDQKFNFLVGRQLQKDYGKKQQSIITVPILEGISGVQKMSKSLNNHIGIMDSPKDIYGKTMSIPDNLIVSYFKLLTDKSVDELVVMENEISGGSINPKGFKEHLAVTLVTRLHSAEDAEKAKAEFASVFAKGNVPEEMPTAFLTEEVSKTVTEILLEDTMAISKKELFRLYQQGAVILYRLEDRQLVEVSKIQSHSDKLQFSLNLGGGRDEDQKVNYLKPELKYVIKAGKRKFLRISHEQKA